MQTIVDKYCHQVPADEVIRLLGTGAEKGLDIFEISRRRACFGPNVLTERKGKGAIVRFLLQFHQPLVYILLVAASVTALLQEWVDSSVIFGVVLINVVVGFIQESKATRAVEALAKGLTSQATVVRSGQKTYVSSTELVPGDIVLLQSGDKVPADLRLIRTRDLQIDESALTGESVPVQKHPPVIDRDTSLPDRKNMAYSCTLVTYGTGTGVVVATSDRTEIGQISEMIALVEVLATPLTRKIKHFSHVLLLAILALSALTFAIGILRGQPWFDTFMAVVALAVAAIPEGLPATVTIILAIGVSRMARRQGIIRRLSAVETLGSTTVICSDKTGTLTQNQMTVQEIFAGGECYQVSGTGYAPNGAITKDGVTVELAVNPALFKCLKAGLLCNDSVLVQRDSQWGFQGDPTEGALIASARKGGLSPEEQEKSLPRIDAIPFESQHEYMATLHDAGDGNPRIAYLKGSVESILTRCSLALAASGEPTEFDAIQVHRQVDEMASKGLRVLAFARKELPEGTASVDHVDVAKGLVFLGLQAMIDPPRPDAAQAVAACHRAGIRVKMITGDYAVTAISIARQLGIDGLHDSGREPVVLTGRELSILTDAELSDAAERTPVFARVSPEHKLRLIEALQARGHVVAMTGDGVNDAPALRRADIGVAMALGGTEVAKQAADMILTDDNFASIEAAVEEGRGVFDNLLKFIVLTLATNGGEALVLMLAIVLGLRLPMLPVHVLWINMMTAVCLGLMLAFEPKERGLMSRPPRDPKAPILTPRLLLRITVVSVLLCAGAFALFEWELGRGHTDAQARTVVVAVIVFGEIFYLFTCRSLTRSMFAVGVVSNPWIWLGVAIMALLQVLFTYLPVMNRLFHTAPVAAVAWIGIIGTGLIIYGVVEAEKWVQRRALLRTG